MIINKKSLKTLKKQKKKKLNKKVLKSEENQYK
jgi:hypothetical protein